MIWNETKECMSRDELEFLQSKRLVKVVDRVYHNVEFYRKKMQALGIEPGDINGIEDLHKLPYTTKNDLRDTYPFGLFAVPKSEIVRVHASSGTTGKATVVGYTRRVSAWQERWRRLALREMILSRSPTATVCLQEGWEPTAALRSWVRWSCRCRREIQKN